MRQFTLNVTTQWNSTLDLLDNLVCLQKLLDVIQAQEGSKPDYKHKFFTKKQWDIIYTSLDILQPFWDITEDLSGQEYPTLEYAFVALKGHIHNCQTVYKQHLYLSIKNLVLLLKAGLEERFQKLQKTNGKMANILMVIDYQFWLCYITNLTHKATIKQ